MYIAGVTLGSGIRSQLYPFYLPVQAEPRIMILDCLCTSKLEARSLQPLPLPLPTVTQGRPRDSSILGAVLKEADNELIVSPCPRAARGQFETLGCPGVHNELIFSAVLGQSWGLFQSWGCPAASNCPEQGQQLANSQPRPQDKSWICIGCFG